MASERDETSEQARWVTLAKLLGRVATQTDALTLQDGSRASLSASGLSVHRTGRERPPAANWLRRSHLAEVLAPTGIVLPEPQKGNFLAVQWRALLSKAFLRHASASQVSADLRALAHHAWWAALPVVQRYDVVFADLLTKAQNNYNLYPERREFEPFWVGIDTPDDELRFDAHASFLLSLRRSAESQFENFCEEMATWFKAHFAYAANSSEERAFGLCVAGNHRGGGACETCPETHADRPYTSIFDGDALFRRMPILRVGARSTKDTAVIEPSVRCFRWILEARSRIDGVARFTLPVGTTARVLNLPRLHERWKQNGFESVLEGYDLSTEAGLKEAHRYMLGFLGSALPTSVVPFEMVYLEAGWGDAQQFLTDKPSLIAVSDAALTTRLAKLGHRMAALRKARQARKVETLIKPVRRRIPLPFTSLTGGPAYTVFVVRNKTVGKVTKNFYSTPFIVDGPRTDPRSRSGQGVLVDGQLCWTVQALRSIANEKNADGEPRYPMGHEFAVWAESHDANLFSDRAFNNAVYDSKLGERIEALTTGEKHHLGRYSEKEDQTILLFFVASRQKKRLTRQDWALLLQRLPGRTERGVLRRFDELGREYAFLNGYEAYMRSPYHRKFSATRKAQWRKEGCPA